MPDPELPQNGQAPSESDLAALQERIGYTFKDATLLRQCLTHPSWALQKDTQHFQNQRLEFLGDAALAMVLAEMLYRQYPDLQEGPLSRRRSALVKGEMLSELALEIQLDQCLYLGYGELRNFKRGETSRLEDALEALIGGIFLDSGIRACRQVIARIYGSLDDRLEHALKDHNAKGRLQEWVQQRGNLEDLRYEVTHIEGPQHERRFTVRLLLADREIGLGHGNSRKRAEHFAAKAAYERIAVGENPPPVDQP